jgi:hypothetical protein
MRPESQQEQSYNECSTPTQHREHLCILMEQGRSREVAERSAHPKFTCRNCGVYADEARDVCNPKPL